MLLGRVRTFIMSTLERRQLSFDPLPLGERAGVVANVPVSKLAHFDGRERTSDGSLSLHLVRVGAGSRNRDGFESDLRLNRSRIGSIRIQRRDGHAGVRATFDLVQIATRRRDSRPHEGSAHGRPSGQAATTHSS